MPSVARIINDVKRYGDSAVKKYTAQFDHISSDQLKVGTSEIESAYHRLEAAEIKALQATANNIELFTIRQRENYKDFEFEIRPGVFTGQKVFPIERVGIYTPGGSYPLPSTVLMCAIPARIAGVEKITLVSPPTHHHSIHPTILAAAQLCGITEIYRVGGVQAIAALAYGTESIPAVDKIVGPGNQYVTAAKKLVYGAVGIDFIAGPTELLVIADSTANARFIAADLLSQAEHDANAIAILVTDDEGFAQKVISELESQLSHLETREIASISISRNGVIIIVDDIKQAIDIANRKAPEHIEVQVKQIDYFAKNLKNYGSLFLGSYAAEVLGDYSSGLNHTLPTDRSARYTGGLSVKDFLKFQTTLRVDHSGLSEIGPHAHRLAMMEGLHGHANSVKLRLDEPDPK
ncbi:histidinol dehydrogenase [candidate division KSB1 bacterium]|nr:histidinol dehydrogenase [candidate division KSB1 bacterium]